MVLLFLLVLVVLATMVIGDSNLTCVLGGSIVFFIVVVFGGRGDSHCSYGVGVTGFLLLVVVLSRIVVAGLLFLSASFWGRECGDGKDSSGGGIIIFGGYGGYGDLKSS